MDTIYHNVAADMERLENAPSICRAENMTVNIDGLYFAFEWSKIVCPPNAPFSDVEYYGELSAIRAPSGVSSELREKFNKWRGNMPYYYKLFAVLSGRSLKVLAYQGHYPADIHPTELFFYWDGDVTTSNPVVLQ
jgi:hypothetical protein